MAAGERRFEIAAPIKRRGANFFAAVLAKSDLAQIRIHYLRTMGTAPRSTTRSLSSFALSFENFCGAWNMTSLARAALMPSGV